MKAQPIIMVNSPWLLPQGVCKPRSSSLPLFGPGWFYPSPGSARCGVTLFPLKVLLSICTPLGKSHSAGDSTLASLSRSSPFCQS